MAWHQQIFQGPTSDDIVEWSRNWSHTSLLERGGHKFEVRDPRIEPQWPRMTLVALRIVALCCVMLSLRSACTLPFNSTETQAGF